MHNARRIAIRGGEHRYEAIVGARLLPEVATLLPKQLHSRSCALVCDETTARLYGEAVAEMLRAGGSAVTLITVAPGEEAKSLENVATICDQMARANLDRSSFLIGLGGGVIGDLSGFVAATFHRGISHVQVPTTLLAMVDSSIGGKTGVNSHAAKNLIGAIHHPALIVADVETLRSLPPRELKQAFAELIKHGVICDAPMLHDLRGLNVSFLGERSAPAESSLTTGRFLDGARNDIEALIARSIRIKSAIVAQDDRDLSGQRAILNFGHTIGHALERAAGYHGLMHGEAVSLGMVAACNISVRRAGLAADQCDQVVELLEIFDLPTRLPSEIERAQILDAIKFDKKFEAGRVRFVVTPKLGEAYLSNDVTFDDIRAAIEEL